MDSHELAGRSALVTGGAGNLGQAIARILLLHGAEVAIADIGDEQRLADAARALDSPGVRVLGLVADVTKEDDCERMVQASLAEFGKLDIVVPNAGVGGAAAFAWETPPDVWRRTLDVNLTGAFLTVKFAIPSMIARRSGKIVFISSRSGLRGEPYSGAYNASKHGLHGLMKTLAIELGPYDINVNAVCPTSIGSMGESSDSERYYELVTGTPGATEADFDQWAGRQNLFERPGRVSADDVAEGVLWLASERSQLVTGHALPLDAGWIAKRGG